MVEAFVTELPALWARRILRPEAEAVTLIYE